MAEFFMHDGFSKPLDHRIFPVKILFEEVLYKKKKPMILQSFTLRGKVSKSRHWVLYTYLNIYEKKSN